MRPYVVAAILTLLGLCPARAEDIAATINTIDCDTPSSWVTKAPTGQRSVLNVEMGVQNYHSLLDTQAVVNLLNRAAAAGIARCPRQMVVVVRIGLPGPGKCTSSLPDGCQWLLTAWLSRAGGPWTVDQNNVSQLVQQETARNAASAARVQLFAKFVKDFGVTAGVGPEALATNPFAYKGKTVSVRTTFDKMISEDQALFGNILVSNVPSATFTKSGMPVLLAIRIEGLTQARNGLGVEVSIPYGTYVGSYICKQSDCLDTLPADIVR
jgi:hypothetical protein